MNSSDKLLNYFKQPPVKILRGKKVKKVVPWEAKTWGRRFGRENLAEEIQGIDLCIKVPTNIL